MGVKGCGFWNVSFVDGGLGFEGWGNWGMGFGDGNGRLGDGSLRNWSWGQGFGGGVWVNEIGGWGMGFILTLLHFLQNN